MMGNRALANADGADVCGGARKSRLPCHFDAPGPPHHLVILVGHGHSDTG